ncbi:LysE family translocator [Phyllobacterium sp. 21LDTY02-6]|uniref:LysE family translocator n=1 Tax=Phyllobacterium sp. 21LDTY02-6 TaxID=2944903 RepID=UPI0020204CC8|nr:LysE family translocator [Phyllobacterium sp. 21LDTY02-6]MCO4316771.1 LysE family translocator [Phyllobacterium sp. 21LDTY02-6]
MEPEYLITSFIIVVSPGTGVVYTLATGLARGARAGIAAAFGCTIGIVPHLAAAIGGLAAVMHASATAFNALKILGVAYLIYMAWNTLREDGVLNIDGQSSGGTSHLRTATTAFLINILNPKLSIFFLAFLPQFIMPTEEDPLRRMLELGSIFMIMTFVVFAIYGLFAAAVRERVVSRPRILAWMRRSFAAAFVALGIKLAFAGR